MTNISKNKLGYPKKWDTVIKTSQLIAAGAHTTGENKLYMSNKIKPLGKRYYRSTKYDLININTGVDQFNILVKPHCSDPPLPAAVLIDYLQQSLLQTKSIRRTLEHVEGLPAGSQCERVSMLACCHLLSYDHLVLSDYLGFVVAGR